MENKHLWAPWRINYIRNLDKGGDCFICQAHKNPGDDDKNFVLWRTDRSIVILNRFPYNNGHLMIVPYAHAPSLEDLEPETAADLMALTQLSLRVLREIYNPQGFNVGLNIGKAAGAGIAGHIHLHVVPRWGGDTNYMTTVGHMRVIPEWLDEMYAQLHPIFEQMNAQEIESEG